MKKPIRPNEKLIGPQNPILDPAEASESNEQEARNLAWKLVRLIEDYSRARDISLRQAYSALSRALLFWSIELGLSQTDLLNEIIRGARTYLQLKGLAPDGKRILKN